MKRISQSALEDMRKRGYDESLMRAQFDFERAEEAERVCDCIRQAFQGVELGSGIGLREAQAIDDWQTETVQAEHRSRDEKSDWSRISSRMLNTCNSSLSFFDAEGMRFHLPAFLIADLKGEYDFGLDFCLSDNRYLSDSCFVLLSKVQRRAVRSFLVFLSDDPQYEYGRARIIKALNEYWTEESCN